MKKLSIIIFALILATTELAAQTGTWSGKLEVQGTSLTLVFNLSEEGCTMDSPDQGAHGIKAELSHDALGRVVISVPSIGASFEGFNLLNSITGNFIQHGVSFPMTLKPGAPKRNRPQTPVGPFPYNTEDVSFTNGPATLKGTLTTPAGCTADTPVVLLVTGSGLQNRDEEIYEHKPFAVIADALAKAGIASLRYDDRGFGESTGDVVNCTTDDLKKDALSGVELLRKRFRRVGVAGHSEGGSIAFMLAAEKKIDFVISLAGGIISMKETLIQQNDHAFRELGFPEDVVKTYVTAISAAFDALAEGETAPGVENSNLPEALKQNYSLAVQQAGTPYMRYFLNLDVRTLLDKVNCPVLAFNGTLDTQVDCRRNLDALRTGLKAGDAEIIEVESANHLLQHCKTGSAEEYKDIEETIASEVLEMMVGWIMKTK